MFSFINIKRTPSVTVLAVASSLAAHILALAVPLALLQTYDRILPNQAYGTTFVLAVGVTIAILLEALLRYGRAVLFAHLGSAFEAEATSRMVDHLMRAKRDKVQALGVPALIDALRSVGQVRDFWSGNAATALHELPFLVIYIALIAYVGGLLAIIPATLTVVAVVAAVVLARTTARSFHAAEKSERHRRELAWGIFGGLTAIKTMAAEPAMTHRYRDAVADAMRASERIENQLALIRENGALLAQVSTIAVVTAGAFMVVSGQITTGGLAACTLLAGRSIGPAMGALSYWARLGQKKEAEAKIARVMSLPSAPMWLADAGGERHTFAGGEITLSGSALAAGPATIPQGTVVHVEATDSFVATAALDAIARLGDILDLRVGINGRPSEYFSDWSIKRGIASASARSELIRGTLLENLTLFSPQYEADAMALAAKLGMSSFVDGLRQGYMTSIGPAGDGILSLGMSARVGLVRALVRQPYVLCLDHVDGALDLDGARRLVQMVKDLKGQTTVFIVSGNADLLALADMTIRVSGRSTK